MSWFATSSGNRLWYRDQGDGFPLVLIHGWCMSSDIWKMQLDELATSYRLILVDLPGHGHSEISTTGFSTAECSRNLIELLKSLEIGKAVVLGWSLGAFIAVDMFSRAREHVAALALVSPTPRFVRSDDFPHGLSPEEGRGMAAKVQRNVERALSGFHSLMLAPGETVISGYGELLASIPIPTPEVALQALTALVESDLRGTLASIECPTLILHGDQDRICLPAAAEFMQIHIPDCQRFVFDGCGHIPFITQSKTFNTKLNEFMGWIRAVTD